MKKRVNVLVSTYNGEKYLREQLNSLYAQTYENIKIYVRDDGSTDATLDILETAASEGKIEYYSGENIGFAGSFFQLTQRVTDGEYWSFCDQDDVWYPEKIARAVEWLDAQEEVTPLLFYSKCMLIDEMGVELGKYEISPKARTFARMMTGTLGMGFCMVINAKMRECMLMCDYEKVHSHDWLIGAIAVGFGKYHMDEKIMANYRRLPESVSASSFSKRVKWAVKSMKNESDVRDRNIEFSKNYKSSLHEKDAKLLSLFDRKGYSFGASIKKAFYPKRWRPSLSSELVMRWLMLGGKV